jgi:hypothetical protein
MPGRYDAAGPEAEFQPGSRGRVLRNRLGITSVRELERIRIPSIAEDVTTDLVTVAFPDGCIA